MDFLQAFILSIVEGITEFLPISSTGHLVLTAKLLAISQTEFVKTFEIAIQSGTILSVIFLYGNKLLKQTDILKRVIWTFIPTGILGFILYKIIKKFLIGNVMVTVLALLVGGLIILVLEKYFKTRKGDKKIVNLSFKESLILGVIQTLSVIPGVSRSATTIFGGMFLGLSREAATELSFMVALPVMLAATGLDLLKSVDNFSTSQLSLLTFGVIVSFLTGIIAIKWLLNYVKKHNFVYFGIYRIILALIFLLFV